MKNSFYKKHTFNVSKNILKKYEKLLIKIVNTILVKTKKGCIVRTRISACSKMKGAKTRNLEI